MKIAIGTGVKLERASRDFFCCRTLEPSNFLQL
jgi:hypothetical protein